MKLIISKGRFVDNTIVIPEDEDGRFRLNEFVVAHRQLTAPEDIHISLKWIDKAIRIKNKGGN